MTASVRRPLLIAAAAAAAFWIVLALAYAVWPAELADARGLDGFVGLQRPLVSDIARPIAHLADPLPFALIGFALAVVAVLRGRPRHAAAVVVLLASANVAAQVLQQLLAHERYHAFLGKAQIAAGAFPSGHATASMSLALAAILVTAPRRRPAVATAGALYTLLVCMSLLTLGWHFPSDVVAGYLLAGGIAALAVAALRAAAERWPERSGREAALAIGRSAFARTAALFAALAAAVLALALVNGDAVADYADDHTTFVAVAAVIAVMAAAVPAALAALSARRG